MVRSLSLSMWGHGGGLLTAFPKLLSSGTREHTFIDTESVRYVYQPLENFFVLIITNKTSNIVEDLHTIQLLSKLVPDICGSLNESTIRDKQFELVFGFDELITAGGHSENINIQQIRVNMEMESHEEKLHNMILESKRAAAKDDMKRQMTRIKEEQRERARMERAGMGSSFANQNSFGSSSNSFGRSPRGTDGFSSPMSASSGPATSPTSYNSRSEPEPSRPIVSKAAGMKLGGGSKTGKSFLDAMAAEDDLKELPPMSSQVQTVPTPEPTATVSHDPIGTVVEEKITVSLNRDGSIEQLEVKGNLYVSVNDPASGCCRLKLRSSGANGISFQTHPKVDKKLFDQQSILGLKDGSKPFPATRVAVLRWSLKTQDESFLPLNITCWPDKEGNDKLNVTIEYEMQRDMVLDNVNILVPLGSHDAPHVASIDGVYQHNSAEEKLLWHQDRIDSSNGSGSMEFSIRGHDLDAFFPIQVSFFSRSVYSDVDIESVFNIEDNSPISYGFEKLLSTDSYQIV
uniref:Coatomer subunit delta n=1 Tax=Globisporangium ultimum (strain ATCC 200006 / CBS 805.95 / DAOM BR144) TaxID=431595 RepID=K3WED7_GLOUD